MLTYEENKISGIWSNRHRSVKGSVLSWLQNYSGPKLPI